MLDGFASRPLREAEFHARAVKAGKAFQCDITWVAVPTVNDDDEEHIESVPVLMPSSLVTCMQ